MKRINKYISLLLATALLASCDKFDEINTDPDATTKVTSSLLATGLLLDITSSSASKSFIYDELLAKQMAWGESMEDYQYNVFGRSGFGGYTTLINAQKMVESVSDDNVNDTTDWHISSRPIRYFICRWRWEIFLMKKLCKAN